MDENDNLETLAAELEAGQTSEELEGELMEGTAEGEEAETQENQTTPPTDEEKENLKAQVQREKDARNGVKADKNLLAKTLKGFMDEYGVTYEEAAKIAGINPNDLKARVENIETSDNPVQAFTASFDDLYLGKGGKALLDDVYGVDTQQYVKAFADHGLSDPELMEQALSLEPAKALNFVVKHGKELLEEMGGQSKSARQLAKDNAVLRAQIAELTKGGQEPKETVQKTTKLPLSGFASGAANGGSGGNALLPKGMF